MDGREERRRGRHAGSSEKGWAEGRAEEREAGQGREWVGTHVSLHFKMINK